MSDEAHEKAFIKWADANQDLREARLNVMKVQLRVDELWAEFQRLKALAEQVESDGSG